MRLAPALAALALAATALAAPAVAETVRGGTIEPGTGVAGIYLGMTRSEVVDQLGQPREHGPAYMSYGPARRSADVSFDVYLESRRTKPVRMIGFWGPGFVMDDGTEIFGREDRPIPALKKRWGDRLRKIHIRRTGTRLYRVKSRLRGERVWTDFLVDRFGRGARVMSAFILLPYSS